MLVIRLNDGKAMPASALMADVIGDRSDGLPIVMRDEDKYSELLSNCPAPPLVFAKQIENPADL